MSSLIKWTPLEPSFWGEDFDNWFDFPRGLNKNFVPAVDVYQDKDAVIVETPLAGIDPEQVDIAIENDVLTIQGKSEKKSEVDDKNYYRKEVRYGSFYRSVQLPSHVKGSDAEAVYENGVLKITVPKAEEAKPRSIKIKTINK